MSQIITHETFKECSNLLERNYRENVNVAQSLVNDFKESMDNGDLKDLAMLNMLQNNLDIAKKALNNYIKLPISGYQNFD